MSAGVPWWTWAVPAVNVTVIAVGLYLDRHAEAQT